MQFSFYHTNYNVRDLDRSLAFYAEALGLSEQRRINAEDGSFIIVYLGDGVSPFSLELTWLRDWDRAYNLGDNEFHLAFHVDDYDAAYAKHKEMGLKIRPWASILSAIPTDTGWRSSRRASNRPITSCAQTIAARLGPTSWAQAGLYVSPHRAASHRLRYPCGVTMASSGRPAAQAGQFFPWAQV